MLGSIIASTPATTTVSPGFTDLVLVTPPIDFPEYGILVGIVLILLLSAKEVLSTSPKWSNSLACSLNMSIVPLIVVFVATILFKLSELR